MSHWKGTVNHPDLPKATFFWISIHLWWFRDLFKPKPGREFRIKYSLWNPNRLANAYLIYIGPIELGWRRPWLAEPARQHRPNLYPTD